MSDKEETESLFAENKKAVTLLISRYLSIDDYFENSDDMYSDNELWNDDSDEKRLLMDSVNATSITTPPSAVPTKEMYSPKRGRAVPNTPAIGSGPVVVAAAAQDLTKLLYHNDPLHHTKVKAHLECVNNEIQLLDQRMEQLMMNNSGAKKGEGPAQEVYHDPVDSRPSIPRSNSMVERFSHSKAAHQIVDSETEHIYETIPEYSETEPIYCSPHDSHVDLMRHHQAQQQQPIMRFSKSFSARDKSRTSCGQNGLAKMLKHRLSSGDDNCDNKNQFSSSPFNTTDSGNSKFLTLEFCANERAHCQGSTLVLCAPGKSGGNRRGEATTKTTTTKQRSRVPTSQSNGHLQPTEDGKTSKGFSSNSNTLPVGVSGDTMYTNAANLEQTITLQQELFRQSMLTQRVAGGQGKPSDKRRGRCRETDHKEKKKAEDTNMKVWCMTIFDVLKINGFYFLLGCQWRRWGGRAADGVEGEATPGRISIHCPAAGAESGGAWPGVKGE